MNPEISNFGEEHNIFKFTLSGVNVSLANALRRIILNDIQTVVFRTETYADNQCTIEINNSRLHNEILKQRLSCIPIFSEDPEELPGKYIMEVDVKNDSDHIMFVTSGDFKIKNKTNGNYLTEKEVRRLFPPDAISALRRFRRNRRRSRVVSRPNGPSSNSCASSAVNGSRPIPMLTRLRSDQTAGWSRSGEPVVSEKVGIDIELRCVTIDSAIDPLRTTTAMSP
jgi:hypothetical protein